MFLITNLHLIMGDDIMIEISRKRVERFVNDILYHKMIIKSFLMYANVSLIKSSTLGPFNYGSWMVCPTNATFLDSSMA